MKQHAPLYVPDTAAAAAASSRQPNDLFWFLSWKNLMHSNSNSNQKRCLQYAIQLVNTQWYIFKRRILLPIWVHFWARILLLKVIYRLFEARVLLLKVIYGLFGARILLRKYIRAKNWTQLAQSNIRHLKMYHWVCSERMVLYAKFLWKREIQEKKSIFGIHFCTEKPWL